MLRDAGRDTPVLRNNIINVQFLLVVKILQTMKCPSVRQLCLGQNIILYVKIIYINVHLKYIFLVYWFVCQIEKTLPLLLWLYSIPIHENTIVKIITSKIVYLVSKAQRSQGRWLESFLGITQIVYSAMRIRNDFMRIPPDP